MGMAVLAICSAMKSPVPLTFRTLPSAPPAPVTRMMRPALLMPLFISPMHSSLVIPAPSTKMAQSRPMPTAMMGVPRKPMT